MPHRPLGRALAAALALSACKAPPGAQRPAGADASTGANAPGASERAEPNGSEASAPRPEDTSGAPGERFGRLRASSEITRETLAPHCLVQSELPRISGLGDAAADQAVNAAVRREAAALRRSLFAEAPCDGASAASPHAFDLTYSLTPTRDRYVALELRARADLGEAEPRSLLHCYVIGYDPPGLLRPGTLFTPEGLAKLGRRVTARLEQEHGVADLKQAGFFASRPAITNSAGICLGDRTLRVVFQPYEVAHRALGSPSVELALDEVRGWLDASSTRALFAPARD